MIPGTDIAIPAPGDAALLLGILAVAMAMFVHARWRHDMVALGALLACVFAGLVAPEDAFTGFGHPAVITVACVLILSRGLQNSGAIDLLADRVLPREAGAGLSLAALVGLGALMSGFINNVGAMAMLMPLAIKLAQRFDMPAGQVLMPLSFGTILGGMTTLIGTPPNLIVSGFRAERTGEGFAMFDFTPVGLSVAAAGVAFVALIGWRLTPARRALAEDAFDAGAYLTEVRAPEDSKAAGMSLREIEAELEPVGAQVVGFVRRDLRIAAPQPSWVVRAGDVLVIEAEVEALGDALAKLGLELEEAKKDDDEDDGDEKAGAKQDGDRRREIGDGAILRELVVRPGASVAGRSASDLRLRRRHGVTLLAVSRGGSMARKRLRNLDLRPGDLLLMQGPPEALADFASDAGCVPLADRSLHLPDRRKALLATLILAGSVGAAAAGLTSAAVAFAAGTLAVMATGIVAPRAVYEAVDWPVIVLLGALLPVAGAMEATGAADMLAGAALGWMADGNATFALIAILVLTMFLSDVMNNAATAAVMCPIALSAAQALGVNPDALLMAVAVGASCAFLTPIGHQNNTLILGPGGFRFGDYWRMGLPLQVVILAVAVPLLPLIWPL